MSGVEYDPHNGADRARLGRELVSKLEGAGFVRREASSLATAEDVFELEIGVSPRKGAPKRPTGLFVVVFSSVVNGSARSKDADAIRVVLEGKKRDGSRRGLRKSKRVFRTGTIDGVIDRTLERAREAYALGLKANGERCKSCGAPLFESKNGNLVCLELCWKGRA